MKSEKRKEEIKTIINRELNYWKRAYPKQSRLLEKFANKIKIELVMQI